MPGVSASRLVVVTIDWVRKHYLQLPHVTEDVKWENNLVFSVANKMFTLVSLEPREIWLSLKCPPEEFVELVEWPLCRQAPYFARGHWVAFESPDALSAREWERLLTQAYNLVFAKLPKKTQRELAE